MRAIVTLIWSVVLGQMVGYIGGALSQQTYDFKLTLVVSLLMGIIILLIGWVVRPVDAKVKVNPDQSHH